MHDRRMHLRVPTKIQVTCKGPDLEFPALALDIGLGGTRLACPTPPRPGMPLTLSLQLPGAPLPSRLPATVRWANGGCFGAQFGRLGPRETYLIVDMMRSCFKARAFVARH